MWVPVPKLPGVIALQPAIHGCTAPLRGRAPAFELVVFCWRVVGVALIVTVLQNTSPYTLDHRASGWSFNRQRELWHRRLRLRPSRSPTARDQRQGDDHLNSSVSHVSCTSTYFEQQQFGANRISVSGLQVLP
jgi:hypothetical protein